MKYYLIVGEASGDLHASHLMASLKQRDPQAEFRFFGGDRMQEVGGALVKHYKELAYMGIGPVLLNLRTILSNMKLCKQDIVQWNPDVVILVDYPGFNLNIAKYVKKKTSIPVYYYISPKIWAWKEYRIKNIKRDVDELFSILPFEVDFYENKHHYPIHYIGNPTVDEIVQFKKDYNESIDEFRVRNGIDNDKPFIALLAGSRKQEIKDNLPSMIQAASVYSDYQLILAGAPGIDPAYYTEYMGEENQVVLVFNDTYPLLSHADAALVTSGTATLETALFSVPQVVCYYTPLAPFISFLKKIVLSVKYISLVNLILNKEAVKELVAGSFSVHSIQQELKKLLYDVTYRDEMLIDYQEVSRKLGEPGAPEHAAEKMIALLKNNAKK